MLGPALHVLNDFQDAANKIAAVGYGGESSKKSNSFVNTKQKSKSMYLA
jgi:hypothetical protein